MRGSDQKATSWKQFKTWPEIRLIKNNTRTEHLPLQLNKRTVNAALSITLPNTPLAKGKQQKGRSSR